jgi:peptide/nickel transport system substrate-binding protein
MIARAFKLRFRRRLRLRKLQVEEFGQQAERQLERNFFRRLERLANVRRFVATWLTLAILLGGCIFAQMRALGAFYKTPTPVPGGTYTEGILGAFTNASPLYATGAVDTTVSKLLFAGLFTYDAKNNLKGDLAESISVDERGTTYTVKLKPGLTWQDGQPVTASDVVFTYQVIQNPDAQSPYLSSWQGIRVEAPDARTVTFTLPSQLSAFPYSLTNGIVPQHILSGKSMQALRTLPFNSSEPVGAGPFRFGALEVRGGAANNREELVALEPFEGYNGGKPQLERFVVHSFRDEQRLLDSFNNHEVTAMVGLTKVPEGLQHDEGSHVYNLPLTAAVMAFFRTSSELLSTTPVRQALTRATNQAAIIKDLGYPTRPVREPILQGQVGYNPAYAQNGYDLNAARKLLDEQGWKPDASGIRQKDGRRLLLTMFAQDNSEYANVARHLQKQWRQAGIELQIILQDPTEFQASLSSSSRSYDVLLHGISIGKDPDVYVYWDSRNADKRLKSRLNFSEYQSSAADAALQAGRTRTDANLRAIKYQPFLQAWRDDAPAVGLYQPRFLYITHGRVHGLDEHVINTDIERFTNVQNWMVREDRVAQVTK